MWPLLHNCVHNNTFSWYSLFPQSSLWVRPSSRLYNWARRSEPSTQQVVYLFWEKEISDSESRADEGREPWPAIHLGQGKSDVKPSKCQGVLYSLGEREDPGSKDAPSIQHPCPSHLIMAALHTPLGKGKAKEST